MITYISVKELNQVSKVKCHTHAFLHIADVFLRNKNRLVLILLDTCSYIDRLGSVDSPRPRNHPFKGGRERNSILFPFLPPSAFDSRQVVPRFGQRISFLSRKRAFVIRHLYTFNGP